MRGIAFCSAALLMFHTYAANAGVLYYGTFPGPKLNKYWQAAPVANFAGFTFVPPSAPTFSKIDGYASATFSNPMNNYEFTGYVGSSTYLLKTTFKLDVRFNTLVQSSATSIDTPISLEIVDAANPNNYAFVYIDTPNYGNASQQVFSAGASRIPNSLQGLGLTNEGTLYGNGIPSDLFSNNTWYHLILSQAVNGTVVGSFTTDNGIPIVSIGLGFSLTDLPNGFKIGFTQTSFTPNSVYPHQVAINYIKLSGS